MRRFSLTIRCECLHHHGHSEQGTSKGKPNPTIHVIHSPPSQVLTPWESTSFTDSQPWPRHASHKCEKSMFPYHISHVHGGHPSRAPSHPHHPTYGSISHEDVALTVAVTGLLGLVTLVITPALTPITPHPKVCPTPSHTLFQGPL